MNNAKSAGVVALVVMCACGPDPAPVQSGFPISKERVRASVPARYTVVEIPQLPGKHLLGWALNNANQVTGVAFESSSSYVPIFYDPRTGTRRLNNTTGTGVAINARGDVAEGASSVCGTQGRALLAHPDGTYENLGTFAGPDCEFPLTASGAGGINDAGQVVGGSSFATSDFGHAFVYQDGVMTDLGTLGSFYYSSATGINNKGQIVGVLSSLSFTHAFVYENGKMKDISPPRSVASSTKWINERGQVVLNAEFGLAPGEIGNRYRPFLYENGQMHDLGNFNGAEATYVGGLNNAGQIVGFGNGAFLWENGQYHSLNALMSDPTVGIEPKAINDHGVILATMYGNAPIAIEALLMPQEYVVPVATLDSSEAAGYAPLWEGFDGTRSYTLDSGTWIARCQWDFGDGSPVSPRCWDLHVYPTAGEYVATLMVTDNLGHSASTTLHISAKQDPGPVIVLSSTKSTGPAPLAIDFDGSRSYAVREQSWISRCRWDFGDGSPPGTLCWAHHIYTTPGRYTATFTATDNEGVSSSGTIEVDALCHDRSEQDAVRPTAGP